MLWQKIKAIYTTDVTWPAWKFGVLKTSMLAFGVLLGAAFPAFFNTWTVWLWAVFGITAVITGIWSVQSLFGKKASTT